MDRTLTAPCLSDDRSMVIFAVSAHGRSVQCGITRDALVQYFWVPPDAAEQRLLQAYESGRQRIVAIAERKVLASTHEPVVLTVSDFTRK